MKHLLTLKDYTKEEIEKIINKAVEIKTNPEKYADILKNKTLIMLFQKTSTRTRLSFEAGMTQLGGHAIFLDSRTSQFSLTDYKDEIKAVMRFGDILMFRAKKFADVEVAASFNQIPVIDACSEKYHPCQALGDILTMAENAGGLDKIKKVVWLGIENNVSNTLKLACAKLGIDVYLVTPKAHEISVDEELNAMAEATGHVQKTLDLAVAMTDADFVHTDTWMDMEFFSAEGGSASGGEEGKVKPEFKKEYEARIKIFQPYQLNAALVDKYGSKAKIMHCMPCHVGYEISRDAIDHTNSLIFDQAENRLHIQKAIMLYLLNQC
ncbi:MAG: ornithine carbamoyltransferase [Candidatus Kerfeldbacteria bacterium CG_4_10_14_0_8_um_filter_42_10]|uniref:Ornithine carbamoyltransferase n=1 Tax=Candidatus Kerfeldbacteria bacterium CG_4_10_14_0_8_um_filter_42_10 TaxID=2014248 RepID=A0A2M7RFS4_9BACT|nr:MAG: ornithine carbamoyltransferase [Candidatus Kerfeldbacteria bacterium CG_4_10_14_0_8_um_filter_42_10]